MSHTTMQPLLLAPQLLPKVWGGRRLERLGKSLPPGQNIGESWELADLAATSGSGAGGQAVRSTIASGPLSGRTLAEAIRQFGRDLLGDLPLTDTGEFPLLVKLLDASDNLSVQVHPSPAYIAAHPGEPAHLKTESWYVVDATPTGDGRPPTLYIGLRPGVTHAAFAAAARAQSPAIVDMLNAVPAVPGECHTLPSGIAHALGAGVVVAEVQLPSDTTFRLYDWGRAGRQLHVEQALESIADPSLPPPQRSSLPEGSLCARLATTMHYTIDEARPQDGDDLTIGYACKQAKRAPFVLMILRGRGELRHAEGGFAPMAVAAGQTVLVPASTAPATHLTAVNDLRVLRVGLCG